MYAIRSYYDFDDISFVVQHGKFGKGRMVPMDPVLAEMVKKYITQVHPSGNPEEWLFVDGFEGRKP